MVPMGLEERKILGNWTGKKNLILPIKKTGIIILSIPLKLSGLFKLWITSKAPSKQRLSSLIIMSYRLATIHAALGKSVPLALHGTHPVSDDLFLKSVECGVRKINLNRTVRDEYTKFVADNAGKLELTVLKMHAVEIYQKSIERMMVVFGSSGMAN